jgi:hypothetical protein
MSKAEEYNSSILGELLNEITPKEAEKTKKRMLLAARIDDGIKAKGWRKTDLANALNKRPSEISKWLSGTHNFNTDTLFEIEEVLSIELIMLNNTPKEQVIKFHMAVSEKAQTSGSQAFLHTPFYCPCFDNYSKQKSGTTGVSSKSYNFEHQS